MVRNVLWVVLLGCCFSFLGVQAANHVLYGNYDSKWSINAYDINFDFFASALDNHLALGEDDYENDEFFSFEYFGNLDFVYSDLPSGDIFFHTKYQRFGRSEYAANLTNVKTTGTQIIQDYLDPLRALPKVYELSFGAPLFKGFRVQAGLHKPHRVGWTGYLFGDKLPNYGVTLSYVHPFSSSSLATNFRWDKPNLNNKWNLEIERPDSHTNEGWFDVHAHRFLFDTAYAWKTHYVQAFVSYVLDHTKNDHRQIRFFDNLTVDKDQLGNAGLSLMFSNWHGNIMLDAARNFGYIYNTNSASNAGGQGKPRIDHEGYMGAASVTWNAHTVVLPTFKFMYFSGGGTTSTDVDAGNTNFQTRNESYSIVSPANTFLSTSTAEELLGLGYASGGMHTLWYGISRPNWNVGGADTKSNLAATTLNLNFSIHDDLIFMLDYWYMYILKPGYRRARQASGTLETVKNSHDHGSFVDLTLIYKWSDHLRLGFLGNLFLPGKYHDQHRNIDTITGTRQDGDVLEFAPVTNNRGDAKNAWVGQAYFTYSF
ncbi:MAG: hypothetical protein HYS98_09155 [Deltaproteobacteria bacterium]|nr:hypothetical protein [Deltaproteobacteria bacterium]